MPMNDYLLIRKILACCYFLNNIDLTQRVKTLILDQSNNQYRLYEVILDLQKKAGGKEAPKLASLRGYPLFLEIK